IEGERGLARTRQPGEHHQPIARDFEIDILEIVLTRAADRDDASGFTRRAAAALVEKVVHAIRQRDPIGEAKVVIRARSRMAPLFAQNASWNVVRTRAFRQSAERQSGRRPGTVDNMQARHCPGGGGGACSGTGFLMPANRIMRLGRQARARRRGRSESAMRDIVAFILGNFTLTFFVIGLVASAIAIWRAPAPRRSAFIVEELFSYFLLFSI